MLNQFLYDHNTFIVTNVLYPQEQIKQAVAQVQELESKGRKLYIVADIAPHRGFLVYTIMGNTYIYVKDGPFMFYLPERVYRFFYPDTFIQVENLIPFAIPMLAIEQQMRAELK